MIAITGGGTGGHLAIAKSLANELAKRGQKAIFIGSTQGQDRQWFENKDEFKHCYFLDSRGVVNKRGLAKLVALANILKLSFSARKILKNHNIKALISVGGYSAAPASFAAIFSGIKLFIHEQNAVSGRLNSLLRAFASGFYSAFEGKECHCDYPVRDEFFRLAKERKELKSVLFLGGSQGAKAINELALKLATHLANKDIKISHQAGRGMAQSVKERYKKLNIEADVFEFDPDMPLRMSKADLAISRAGASTLWELSANALPAIFVPYPHAASDHQNLNASALANIAGKEFVPICQEGQELDQSVLKAMDELDIAKASLALKNSIKPNGAKDLIDLILSQSK